MSNGATMKICEYRRVGLPCREMFNIFGTKGCFYGGEGDWGENKWFDLRGGTALSVNDMRDPLPEEVHKAFQERDRTSNVYGGHGGSHAYLAHEFVDAIAHGRQRLHNQLLRVEGACTFRYFFNRLGHQFVGIALYQ